MYLLVTFTMFSLITIYGYLNMKPISFSPLIQTSIELVKKTQILYNILALHSIAVLLQFVESISYSKIDNDTHSIIMIYGFFVMLNLIYKKWIQQPYNIHLFLSKIQPGFYKWSLGKYRDFSFETKNKNPYSTFRHKLDSADGFPFLFCFLFKNQSF